MANIAVFIDGFNLYHALDYIPRKRKYAHLNPHRYRRYKWLDLMALAKSYVYDRKDSLAGTFYFTTFAHWDAGKVAKHRNYVRALESRGVTVIEGKFKEKRIRCKAACGQEFVTFEEKQTDVNIALTMLKLAVGGFYEKAIVISGDTDLIPAFDAVREHSPKIEIVVVLPIGRSSCDMIKAADFHHQMKEAHLQSALLPDPCLLPDGSFLSCPSNWR